MIEVSVIIAAYNVAPYIKRAIDNALGQDGVNLEVIVVDDCSTDGTWDIVSAIEDPRLRTRRNHENHGPSTTRNEAIAMANGRWIAVLDGDDEFLPGRLARCLARAKATNADIVADNVEVRREVDGATFPMFVTARFARMDGLDLAGFIAGNRLFAKGYTLGYLKPIFSAAFLRQHNLAYDTNTRIGEDYQLLTEALACGACCAIDPSIGYAYTVRAGSISHRLTLADIDRMMKADEDFLACYRLQGNALKAQARRTKSLYDAYDFTQLIEALKGKDIISAGKIALTCPRALFLLWRPIVARLKRL